MITPDEAAIVLSVLCAALIAALIAIGIAGNDPTPRPRYRRRQSVLCKQCGLIGEIKHGHCDWCRHH